MPNRQKSQISEEALCQIHRVRKFSRRPCAKSPEISDLRGSPMQNRRLNKKSFSFVEFHDFFKENLISKKLAVQPRRLARKIRKNQHFLIPFA